MDNISDGLKRRFRDPKMREQYLKLCDDVVKDPAVAQFLKDKQERLSKQDSITGFSKLNEFVNLIKDHMSGNQNFTHC